MARHDTNGSSVLAPNDPYNDMEGANIRPDFGITNSSNKPPKSTDNSKTNQSKDLLRNSESSAISKKEPAFESSWKNNVSGKSLTKNLTGKGKGKFNKKKSGIAAMMVIISLLVGGGAFLGSSHSLLAPALSYHGTTKLSNFSWSANDKRRVSVLSDILDGKRTGKALSSLSKIPNWLKQRFAKTENFTVSGDSISWKGQNLSGENFSKMYNSSAEFRNDVTNAAYGRVISMQDTTNINTMNDRFGVTGNTYSKYKQTGNSDLDNASYRQTAGDLFDNKTSSTISASNENEVTKEVDQGDGTTKTEIVGIETGQTSATAKTTNTRANIQAANDYLRSATDKVGKVVNYGCTILRAATMVAIVITGVATVNYTHDALSNYMEPISKMMDGSGSESPINAVLNRMTTPFTTKVDDLTDLKIEGDVGDINCTDNCPQGSLVVTGSEITYDNKSFVQSSNMVATISDQPYNKKDAAIHSFNRSLEATITSLKAFNVTNAFCVGLQAAVAGVDLLTQVVGIGLSILPGGQVVAAGGVAWQGIKSLFKTLFVGITLNFAVSSFMAFLVPQLAQTLFSTPDQDAEGVPAAERVIQALAITGSKTSQYNNGGGPTNQEQALAYNKLNQETIAREAELDRINRSPFDITSSNTFLGSIIHSLLPVTLTNKVSSVQTIMSATSSAIANITNSAKADGEDTAYLNTFGDCQHLKETYGDDVAADIYCNPIILNDTSTLETDINDPRYSQLIDSELECDNNDKNCSVKTDGDLAKYISFCADRTSPFGVLDANILNQLETGSVILNALPIAGNVVDIMNSFSYPENEAWATGAKCSPMTNPEWEDKYKYYQLYIMDMHIAEQIGAGINNEETGYNNPVAAYRKKYAEEHPQDNSFAGYISRVSGITKEDAEGIIAVAEYYQYLQEYDANTRIALNNTNIIRNGNDLIIEYTRTSTNSLKKVDNSSTNLVVLGLNQYQYIIYNDVRNRNFTV